MNFEGMRILFIAQTFYPVMGGAERYIDDLAREMSRKGADVTVMAPDFRHDEMGKGLKEMGKGDGYDIIRTDFLYDWKRPLYYHASALPFARDLKRIMKDVSPDIVHFQYPNPFGTLQRLVRFKGAKPFTSSHGSEILFLQADPIGKHLFRSVLEGVEAVFTVSNECTDIIRQGTSRKANIHVTYCGTRPDHFTPKEGPVKGPPVILSAQRLARRKGIDITVDAFDMIAQRYPKAELHIVGDGPERGTIDERREKATHGDRIILLGKVSDEKLLEEYRNCTVHVIASRTIPEEMDIEGFGITNLEAMACGRPVIGSTAGGIPSAIKEGPDGWGLLFKEGQVRDLARKLDIILSEPERAEAMGRRGRQAVETIYNWDVVSDKMGREYSRSLKK